VAIKHLSKVVDKTCICEQCSIESTHSPQLTHCKDFWVVVIRKFRSVLIAQRQISTSTC